MCFFNHLLSDCVFYEIYKGNTKTMISPSDTTISNDQGFKKLWNRFVTKLFEHNNFFCDETVKKNTFSFHRL